QSRHPLDAVEHRAALVELELVLREVRGHDAVAERTLEQLVQQGRLARTVRADEDDVLAALDRQRDAGEEVLRARAELEGLDGDDRAPAARRVEEVEPERPPPPRQELQLVRHLLPF